MGGKKIENRELNVKSRLKHRKISARSCSPATSVKFVVSSSISSLICPTLIPNFSTRQLSVTTCDDMLRFNILRQRQLRIEQDRRAVIADYIGRWSINAVMADYVRKTTEVPPDSQLDFYGDAQCFCPEFMRDEAGECCGRMAMNAQAASTSTYEPPPAAEASSSETNGRDVNKIEDCKFHNIVKLSNS